MIKKIVIEIAGEEKQLTLEEAEKLHRDLDKLFHKPYSLPDPLPYVPPRTGTPGINPYSPYTTSYLCGIYDGWEDYLDDAKKLLVPEPVSLIGHLE